MALEDPLLVVLVGPTASGKTALAIELAKQRNGEIVSCDSVAIYQDMELGTAKPSKAERAQIPHHMLDVVPPTVEYTAGDYARAARAAIADIRSRNKMPIIAGGTGLYLRALLDGLSPVPQRDEALRDRLRAAVARRGTAILHRALRRLDPAAAAKIHANDQPKLIRAIEVSVLKGQPMTQAWSDQKPQPLTGFRILQFGLAPDRAALYTRINTRCEAMFQQGLVEETKQLLAKYGPTRALQSLGYAEAQAVLNGTLTQAQAIAAAQQGHRNYSKRQGTWFRKDPRIHWLHGFGPQVAPEALSAIHSAATP